MTKTEELLALADALEGNVKHWSLTVTMPQTAAALREYAATMDAERDALRADAQRLDWIECNVMNGKLEIAQSLFKRGYEFGFHQERKRGAFVGIGTLRQAIDAARITK